MATQTENMQDVEMRNRGNAKIDNVDIEMGADKKATTEEFKPSLGPQFGLVLFNLEGEDGITTWSFWRAILAEFWATFMFLLFTIGTVTSTGYNASLDNIGLQPNGNGLDTSRQLIIALTFGIMIFTLVYMTAGLSGGNINPAVTTMCIFTKRLSLFKGICYILAQMGGATVGACTVYAMNEDNYVNAVNAMAPGWTEGAGFVGEFFGTMLLVMCVQTAIDPNVDRPGKPGFLKPLAALAIGWCVSLAHFFLIPITNCGINPARSFGASVVKNTWDDQWIFWVAPLSAAVVSAFAYEFLFKDKK